MVTADKATAKLMDITEVAERLGVQVRHVRRLVAERRIPYLKWGHLLRFDPADIDQWLDQARRPAGGPDRGRDAYALRDRTRG